MTEKGDGGQSTIYESLIQDLNNLSTEERTSLIKHVATSGPYQVQRDIATVATQSLPAADKRDVALGAVQTLPPEQKQQIQNAAGDPSQKVNDQIWRLIVGSFAAALVISALALLYVTIWQPQGETNSTQVLLTVFTSIAGILAGFIAGRASAAAPSGAVGDLSQKATVSSSTDEQDANGGQKLEEYSQWREVVVIVSQMQAHGQNNLFVGIGIIGIGAVLLALAIRFGASLDSFEFIAAFILGTLLAIFGGGLQAYTVKAQANERRDYLDSSKDVFNNVVDAKYSGSGASHAMLPGVPTTPAKLPSEEAPSTSSPSKPPEKLPSEETTGRQETLNG